MTLVRLNGDRTPIILHVLCQRCIGLSEEPYVLEHYSMQRNQLDYDQPFQKVSTPTCGNTFHGMYFSSAAVGHEV